MTQRARATCISTLSSRRSFRACAALCPANRAKPTLETDINHRITAFRAKASCPTQHPPLAFYRASRSFSFSFFSFFFFFFLTQSASKVQPRTTRRRGFEVFSEQTDRVLVDGNWIDEYIYRWRCRAPATFADDRIYGAVADE